MNTNGSVTLFHYDSDKEEYIRSFFPEASVYYEHKSAPSEKGVVYDNTVIIRIPTPDSITVKKNDYLMIGNADKLQREEALKIIGYTDNRRGSHRMQHWRFDCE